MQTVVLAAGEGTRMRPLTARRPKPMLPVADRPLVGHTVSAAIAAGASSIALVVGYEADDVRDYFGDEFEDTAISYAVQAEQRGTADAVRAAADDLASDEPFVVLNGDALYDHESLSTLYDADAAVGSYRVDNPSNYGVLETTESGRVTGVVEKPPDPPSNLINTGAYVFPAEAQDWLAVGESERGELELTDVLERTCNEYSVESVPFSRWLDVGRPWELLEANEWKVEELERDISGDVHADADLRGDVVVEEGATVDAGVVVEGPALIREGASVGPNAYVRGATVVGAGAKVGHAVEVKNSVLMEGATVGHLGYVGDSILGRDVNFGAGTKVANLRHDDQPVKLTVKGERVSTGRRKFGVVVGDGAKTGINVSLNAGVVLSTDARVAPGEVVTRDR
ncbi:bifunctional UDP-N-acetylglucosamine pyrophosphorylase / Glucosamine-1-phosphate N-acetyltransferase [Halogranum gelatinilyticum]|uniref:Bifunctional protein GlmU n=1 Tax=Halogranum gelatinilyticum TaxID=660521 RepID=A0A1G9UTD0_9EURY|nr:bifunctional sugar-1-phosphate nucleotidylyltransferase/acetyltransferase [Halogranum gelatinilyticum]SDM63153.1 bifunctional UDP-N-acetylglucosamine pyrophosphorylase / Glucosamine-1-phosphate N-acetyltransferase [Halogranum gelatinilyticum]